MAVFVRSKWFPIRATICLSTIILWLIIDSKRVDCLTKDNGMSTDWQQVIKAADVLKDNRKLDFISRLINSANVSLECRHSIRSALDSYQRLTDWSYKLLDSWGEFPPKGVIEGTVTDFGDFDQCLSIEANPQLGRPQYCLLDVSLPMPIQKRAENQNYFDKINVIPNEVNLTTDHILRKLSEESVFFYWLSLRTGLCLPDRCNQQDVELLVTKGI